MFVNSLIKKRCWLSLLIINNKNTEYFKASNTNIFVKQSSLQQNQILRSYQHHVDNVCTSAHKGMLYTTKLNHKILSMKILHIFNKNV